MDPFSLLTGSLTLIGACATVSRTFSRIRDIKEAPILLHSLNNEISDLQLALMDVKDYLQRIKKDEASSISRADMIVFQRCSSVIDRIKDKILEVDSLLQYNVLKAGKEEIFEINTMSFLREQDHLRQLHTDLRDARQQIAGFFSRFGVQEMLSIKQVVTGVHDMALRSHAEMRDGITTLAENQIGLAGGQKRIEEGQTRILRDLGTLLERRLVITQPSTPSLLAEAERPVSNVPQSIAISIARARYPLPARVTCSCPQQVISRDLKSCLGRLFIGYVATPVFDRHDRRCRIQPSFELVLVYFFPAWFLSYMFLLQTRYSRLAGLSCSLTINPILSFDHAIFDCIISDDIVGIKKLFQLGQVSPECQDISGGTLLHLTIFFENVRATELLLQLGADPVRQAAGFRNPTPYQFAWLLVLRLKGTAEWREKISSLFPDPDLDDLFNFSVLHKAVINLPGHNLESVIQNPDININIIDAFGRTPLDWAACRGDVNALKILLARGADCNHQDYWGTSSLTFASSSSKDCVDMLLAARADVRACNQESSSALHYAVSFRSEMDSIEILQALVDAGADINAQNMFGETALMRALQRSRVTVANHLIEVGAALDLCDLSGNSALCWAIRFNSSSAVQHLLRKGADHTSKLDYYHTFIHLVAARANVKTLQLLAGGGLKRRDINVKNRDKLAPLQVSWQREDVDAEWREAFTAFLMSLDQDYTCGKYHDDIGEDDHEKASFRFGISSSDDEFEDALQFQTLDTDYEGELWNEHGNEHRAEHQTNQQNEH